MSIMKKAVFAVAGLGLVASTGAMSAQPLRAGASLPSVSSAMLSAPALGRAGAASSARSDARGKAGFGNFGVFILAGVVLVAIIVVVASSKNGKSPG